MFGASFEQQSINCKPKDIISKLNGKRRSQWYCTQMCLHAIFPKVLDVGWQCQSEKGMLLYIWLSYPWIRLYWTDVHSTYKQITDQDLPFEPANLLTDMSPSKYKQCLTIHLLNAAKTLIPRFWKSTSTPELSV